MDLIYKESKINQIIIRMRIGKILFIFVVVIFFAAIGLSVWYFEYKYTDKFYPGVSVNGVSVSGLSYEEVLNQFKSKSTLLEKNGLNIVLSKDAGANKKEINIPGSSAGFTSDVLVEYFFIDDVQKMILQAYNSGRNSNFFDNLKQQALLMGGRNFELTVQAHREAITSLLTRETKKFFKAGSPARFSFNDSGEIIIIPEKLGDDSNIDSIVDIITEKLMAFETQIIVVNIKTKTPLPATSDLKQFVNLAKDFSDSANVIFHYQGKKWKVDGKTLATWLTLNSDYQLTINSDKLKSFLNSSVVALIENPPQNSRFEMRDGVLVETVPGKSGNAVNIDKAVNMINDIVPQIQQAHVDTGSIASALGSVSAAIGNVAPMVSGISSVIIQGGSNNEPKITTIDVPIEIIEEKPEVTKETIDKYEIKDLIGTARTNFTGGSADRQHNIEVGVSKLTGILIAPGEEFSTVKSLGEVTEEAGFVKEYVIKENQTVKELGGGLCQLATTLFRTALNAGLHITERINHKYVISYYGPGLDATIYDPKPDFRFLNDTGNYVLLQGKAKNDEVIFELYGVSDNRKVEIGKPVLSDPKPVPDTRIITSYELPAGTVKCETVTHEGITADTTYKVTYQDGTEKETIFHSVYQPWPKVCLVGAATN